MEGASERIARKNGAPKNCAPKNCAAENCASAHRAIVSIILMLLSRPGKASRIVTGLPLLSGSMYFSSVERYLTLSFASLFASVIELSRSFHRLSTRLLAAVRTPSTTLHSRPLSCSVIELNFAIRLRQYSSSVSGPASSDSARPPSLSASSFSVPLHHSSTTLSNAATISASEAARLNAAALLSTSNIRSGFFSVKPPCSDSTASPSVSLNLPNAAKKSAAESSPSPRCHPVDTFCSSGR